MSDLSSAAGSPAKRSEAGSEPDVMDTDDRVADRQDEEDLKEDLEDLFGDDDEDIQTDKAKKRRLDDEELDSGDDMERNDRLEREEEDVAMEIPEEITTTDVQLNRHHALRGSDGEVYLLHQQNFTGIEPTAFDPDTFSPPKGPHNSQEAPGPQFSAAQTAASTIRWRRSPRDASALQSNARIVRWSDGSLTLQIASNPTEQYELPATARAAPQFRPIKPTPISKPLKKGMQPRTITDKDNYHLYLCSVHEDTGYARVTNHVTVSLAVRSTRTTRDENVDDATLKLQEIMAKNAATKQNLHKSRIISTKEDPLEAQRRAIKADKELAKAVRQKQLKEEKELAKRHGAMGNAATYGRSGGSGYGRYDDDRPKSKVPRKKANRSRYSDDDDIGRGRTREDEYDEEDDFIAPSDEDGEDIVGDDEDEDEEEILDDDADAEGEADDDVPAPAPAAAPPRVERTDSEAAGAARNKRRQVIDDDDDDE